MTFVALATIYSMTAFRTVAPGDSTELTVALSRWGVPHAPGFPLLALAGNVATHVFPARNPAMVLNLMNACFAAMAAAVVAAAVTTITCSIPAGIIAGLALGVSRVFWHHALAIEAFSLNAMFAALLLLALCRALSRPTRDRATWAVFWFALVATTGLTHHATIALIVLPVAITASLMILAHRPQVTAIAVRRWSGVAILGLVMGAIPLAYIPIASHFRPVLNWGNVHDLGGLLHLVLRRDYGTGTLIAPWIVVNQVLLHGEQVSPQHWRHYVRFFLDLPGSLGWFMLPLIALGLLWASRRCRPLLWCAIGFMAVLTLFFSRVNTPLSPLFISVTEGQYVLPHLVLALYAGLGSAQIMEWVRGGRRTRTLLAGVLLAATVVPTASAHWKRVDAHDDTFTRDFGRNLLVGMPSRTVFLTAGEMFDNAPLYAQQCEERRPDVSFIAQSIRLPWYFESLVQRGVLKPQGDVSSTFPDIVGILDRNADVGADTAGRPFVAVKIVDPSYASRYQMVPMGIWARIVRRSTRGRRDDWVESYAAIARAWDLRSLARSFPEGSWQSENAIYYDYAIGQLLGLNDVQRALGARTVKLPSLQGTRRRDADLMAYRADAIRMAMADSTFPVPERFKPELAGLAWHWAEESLVRDSTNLQALQALAQLMADRAKLRNDSLEYAVRRRIVDQLPGIAAELTPLFRVALRFANERPAKREAVLSDLDRVRNRYLRIMNIAHDLSGMTIFVDTAHQWTGPVEDLSVLRE